MNDPLQEHTRAWTFESRSMRPSMELDTVNKLLKDVALTHPKLDDSKELEALRNVSLALMHIAGGIAEIQKTQTELMLRGR